MRERREKKDKRREEKVKRARQKDQTIVTKKVSTTVNTDVYVCPACDGTYDDETESPELSLDCSISRNWYHAKCTEYDGFSEEELQKVNYVCSLCCD